MALVISLINQKGGVGKSTLTFNLGAAFAAHQCRTLLVDADQQGNLSSGFFGPAAVEALPERETIAGLFSDRPPLVDQVIKETAFERLCVLPSNELLSRYCMPVQMAGSRVATLRDAVLQLDSVFDVILIDNAPALNSISWASLLASQWTLVPTIPEDYSSQGLSQVCRTIAAARERNRRLSILGFVLTMVQPRLTVHRAYEMTLREQYPGTVFNTLIKGEKLHKECLMERTPLCFYKPNSVAARAYLAMVDEIVERIERSEQTKEAA